MQPSPAQPVFTTTHVPNVAAGVCGMGCVAFDTRASLLVPHPGG